MAINERYVRTRQGRFKLGELIQEGMNEREAYKIAFPKNNNIGFNLKAFKEKGIYPFGDIDGPGDDLEQLKTQVKDIHTEQATINEPQIAMIRDIVRHEVSSAIQQQAMQSITIRPILKRTQKNTKIKTFRCPQKLWVMAEKKARSQGMSLNGFIEMLLFNAVGNPKELLEE
jgi:predicted HicB family RNase H-like nuclease